MSRTRRIAATFSAGELPEEVSGGIDTSNVVEVTVEDEAVTPRFGRLRGIAAHRRTSIEDAVARVRALRDDWD